MIRSYSELCKLKTFEERLDYLQMHARVGEDTFGSLRYLNQNFYRSPEWRRRKREIIIRDNGCDLGLEGYDIYGRIYIHHINPISSNNLKNYDPDILLSSENLICCKFETHQSIHYGNEILTPSVLVERRPGDTTPWLIKE